MPKEKKSDAIHFLETTLRSVEILGQKKTITLLNQAISNHNINTSDIVDLMFLTVCNEFQLDKNELLFGTSRKDGSRVGAIVGAVRILSEHTKLSYTAIGNILNKTSPEIAKYKSRYVELNEKIKTDKELLQKIGSAESDFIKKTTKNNKK